MINYDKELKRALRETDTARLRAKVVLKLGANLEKGTSSKEAQTSTLLGLPVGFQMFMSTLNI